MEKWKMAKLDKRNTNYRASGVLLHITSMPNEYNTLGVFSDNCMKFVDWLAEGGFKIWQVLPINDCGYYYSPYSAISTYAVNPYLIDLSQFLSKAEIDTFGFDKEGDRLVEEAKIDKALDLIYDKFGKTTDITEFVKDNKAWLDDYACFKVLKKIYKDTPWTEFPTELKNRDKVILDKFKLNLLPVPSEPAALSFRHRWRLCRPLPRWNNPHPVFRRSYRHRYGCRSGHQNSTWCPCRP